MTSYFKVGFDDHFNQNCQDSDTYRNVDSSFDFGKDHHKCSVKFVDAHHKLMRNSLFKVEIQTGIKNESEARRLCSVYQQLANKEPQNLFCYVDYVSLCVPLCLDKFVVHLCNFDNIAEIRKECIFEMVKHRLEEKTQLIILSSFSRDYVIKVGRSVLKEHLKPLQLSVCEKYFNQIGPQCPFFVLFIDTSMPIQSNDLA